MFDNLNISPSPKIPSHKGRGIIREDILTPFTSGEDYICR